MEKEALTYPLPLSSNVNVSGSLEEKCKDGGHRRELASLIHKVFVCVHKTMDACPPSPISLMRNIPSTCGAV